MTSEIRQEVASERLPGLRFSVSAVGVAGVRLSIRQFAAVAGKAAGLRARFGRRALEADGVDDEEANWFRRSFFVLVVLPVAASFVYFQFLASDQFISETQFAVRGATKSLIGADALAASGLGVLAGLSANQDVFIVAEYIRSQRIIDDLSNEIDLRAIFSAPRADFLSRFDPSKSRDDFLRYWRKAVEAQVEVVSGLLTVRVKTFSSADSVRLATAIRARCDAIVNELLDGMRRDMTKRGEAEVRAAMDRLAEKRARLEQFRNARMAIDPLNSAHSMSETITELRRELIEVEVKLASARSALDPDGLQIKILRSDHSILAAQIASLEGKITSVAPNPATAAAALAEYDRLEVEKTLSEKRAALAEQLLDKAREDANRRHIYLASIEDPTTPQSSLFPRRGFATLTVFFGALAVWCVVSLAVAGVRDHAK